MIAPVVKDYNIKKDQIYANEFMFNKNGMIKTISKKHYLISTAQKRT